VKFEEQEDSFSLENRVKRRQPTKVTPKPTNMEPVSFEAKLPKIYKNFNQPLNPQLLKTVLIGPPNAGKSTILNNLVQNEVILIYLASFNC
jgi:GTP-binding protein Era